MFPANHAGRHSRVYLSSSSSSSSSSSTTTTTSLLLLRLLQCGSFSLWAGEQPLVQRQQTKHAGREAAGRRHPAPLMRFSPATAVGARATCRINGSNFPSVFPSSSLQRAATPTASLYFVSPLFPRTRLASSGAAWALVPPPTSSSTTADRGASCQPRARQNTWARSRAVLRKSDSGAVRARGGGATAVRDGSRWWEATEKLFWEIAFETKRGFFPALLASSPGLI